MLEGIVCYTLHYTGSMSLVPMDKGEIYADYSQLLRIRPQMSSGFFLWMGNDVTKILREHHSTSQFIRIGPMLMM